MQNMKRISLLVLVMTLFLSIANAQNPQISGRVRSSEDNRPLSNVTVTVVDENIRTMTGRDGLFTFKELPESARILRFECTDYDTIEKEISPQMIVNMKELSFYDKEALCIWLMVTGVILSIILCCVYYKTKARAVISCIPGIFTSLGLLGTFIAIYLSLKNPDQFFVTARTVGETVGNASSSQSSGIIRLIKELIPAFSSSIVGLVFAILATFSSKIFFAYEDKREEEKNSNRTPEDNLFVIAENTSALLSTLPNLSEQINDVKTAIVGQLVSQENASKDHIEKLNSTIAQQSTILEKFIEDFVKKMDVVLINMSDKIEKQVNLFGEDQFKKTSVVINDIAAKMSTMSEALLASQSESISLLMSNTNTELKNLTSTLSTDVSKMSESLAASLNALGAKQNDELATIVGKYTSMIATMQEQNDGLVVKLDSINDNTTKAIQGLQEKQVSEFSGIVELYNTLTEKLVSQNTDLATQMGENHTSLLNQVATQNTEFTTKMQAQMQEEYAKVQKNNSDSLQQMVDLKDAYQEITEQVVTRATQMSEQSVAELTKSMTGFVTDLQTSIGEHCSKLKESLTVNVSALDAYYKNLKDAVADLKVNYDQAVRAYEDAVTIAHRTNESSEKMLKEVAKGLKSVADTNQTINEMIKLISNRQDNLDSLRSRINEINASITSLQRVETMLNKFLDK